MDCFGGHSGGPGSASIFGFLESPSASTAKDSGCKPAWAQTQTPNLS